MSSSTSDGLAATIADRHEHREPFDRITNQAQVAEAIQAADEPLSKRQLRHEAHPLSDAQISRALRKLADLGIVKHVQDPDDGRITRYRLCETQEDTDRGQITPVAAGVLMLAVGLLLLAAITIGVVA
ncbi:helix-turn-helix domain-containing protein [Natronoarchaeum rubrum]|uniref:helix-turn-helix domain-containing protein n=1 Tax=Natronoarchaeum rubrum TaxID=755311 RepID=UPI00211299E2|nr:MarR family transcriptional regulator [Natronoarchaeum rubrum]